MKPSPSGVWDTQRLMMTQNLYYMGDHNFIIKSTPKNIRPTTLLSLYNSSSQVHKGVVVLSGVEASIIIHILN